MILKNLIKGKLIKRYKRFLMDAEIENGEIVIAHCTNTGSMKTLLDDPIVFMSESDIQQMSDLEGLTEQNMLVETANWFNWASHRVNWFCSKIEDKNEDHVEIPEEVKQNYQFMLDAIAKYPDVTRFSEGLKHVERVYPFVKEILV